MRGSRDEGLRLRTAPEFQPATAGHEWLANSLFVGLAELPGDGQPAVLALHVHRLR